MEKEIAEILLDIKAVTLSPNEPYIFASGIKSPIYCDNRIIISYPEKRTRVVDAFIEKIKDLHYDIIGGTATAGIPWAAWIADKLNKPMIYIRSGNKEHGKGNQIEGDLKEGQLVLIVEDLISTGKSSVNAVEAVRNAGGIVNDCVAIFTYGMTIAEEKFADSKCTAYPLSNFQTLIDIAITKNYIDENQKDKILAWSKNPAEWNSK